MPYEGFIEDVEAEVNSTDADWLESIPEGAADRVDTTTNRFVASSAERALIQDMGRAYGCHTCNKYVAHTPQRYIVDHIPPKEMVGPKSGFRFFPHCDRCASRQATRVREYKQTKVQKILLEHVGRVVSRERLAAAKGALEKLNLDASDIKLFCGGEYRLSIPGQYGNPNAPQRKAVQKHGKAAGCHSCATKQPSIVYHADHCPPREIAMTSWFPAMMRGLGKPLDGESYFRPQCPSCSHAQGQRCKALVSRGLPISKAIGVIRYPA